ncbi:unnamed protein product, partial [Didymodactylos carnosus]
KQGGMTKQDNSNNNSNSISLFSWVHVILITLTPNKQQQQNIHQLSSQLSTISSTDSNQSIQSFYNNPYRSSSSKTTMKHPKILKNYDNIKNTNDKQCNYVDMPPQQFSNANNYPTFLIEPQRRQLPSTPASIIEKEDDNDDDDDGGGGSSTLDKQIKAKLLLLHQRHNSSIQKQSS